MRINWNPARGEDIAQCVRALLATAPGTVPLSRAMGTPQDVLDTPQSIAGARLQAAVATAIKTYEPRAKVVRLALEAAADGSLDCTVEIAPNG